VSSLSLKTIQSLELPLPEIVSGRIGFIHDLFLDLPYEVTDDLPDDGKDLVVITGKENRRDKMLELADYPGRVLLVLAPGDASFRASYFPDKQGLPPNFVAAYVTNNELPDRRVSNIPLGVRINKLRPLQFVRQNHSGGRPGLLYGNFALNEDHYRPGKDGRPHIRAVLAEQFADAPWAKLEINSEQQNADDSLINFYSEISSHKFVLSPEGNGIDCYRTWECLYLGAIPIVMVSPCMSTFGQLPILFTNDYSEISEEYLEEKWDEMSKRRFDIRFLLKSHYHNQFLATVAMLEDPHFVCWGFTGTPNEKFHRILERSSRSASEVVAETPVPPFVSRRSLTDPGGWNISGDLDLRRREEALMATAGEKTGGSAEVVLNTIAGGRFRISGRIEAQDMVGGKILLATPGEAEPLGLADVTDDQDLRLDMSFVGRGDRAVLAISMGASKRGARCLLRDLQITPEV
jgi:hypothetical protein